MLRRLSFALAVSGLFVASTGAAFGADEQASPTPPSGLCAGPWSAAGDFDPTGQYSAPDLPSTIVVSGEPTLAAAYRVTGKQLGRYVENKPRNLGLKPRQLLDMCIFDGDFVTTTSGPPSVDKSAARVLVIVVGADHRFLLRAAKEESGIPLVDPSAEGEGDLLSRLVTEEVEPGVHRILSDGFRELSPPTKGYVFEGVGKGWGVLARSHEYRSIVAARDGSVWVFEPDRFFRIGRKKERGWDGLPGFSYDDDFAVSPDGTAWRVAGRGFWPEQAWSFDGKKWTRHKSPRHVRGVEIDLGGTVWTTWWRPFGVDSIVPDKLARWNGKRWSTVDIPRAVGSFGPQFASSGKNDVWFCCKPQSWRKPQNLLHYDGRRWKTVADPAPQDRPPRVPILIDGVDDGRLWMRRSPTVLARHDDRGWAVFESGERDPVMDWLVQETGGFLRGSPDGSAWVTVSEGSDNGDCDGIARFDGEAWTRYLRGRCIFAIDIAPDGTAWLQAALMAPNDGEQWLPLEPIQTYAIRPATGSEVVNPGGRIPEQEEVMPAIGAMESGEGFAGVYYVPKRRDLPVFLVTGDRDEAVEKIKGALGDDATFEVRMVERSMEELLSIKDRVFESRDELREQGITLVSVGPDVVRNRVDVGVLDKVRRAREALGDYGDAIYVVKQDVDQLDRAGGLPEGRLSWPLPRRTGIP